MAFFCVLCSFVLNIIRNTIADAFNSRKNRCSDGVPPSEVVATASRRRHSGRPAHAPRSDGVPPSIARHGTTADPRPLAGAALRAAERNGPPPASGARRCVPGTWQGVLGAAAPRPLRIPACHTCEPCRAKGGGAHVHRVPWNTAETAARRAAPAKGRGSAVVPWHPRPLLAKKARPPGVCARGPCRREVGGALLSRALERSIIAAGALNGRVRDGNGCLGSASATNQRVGHRRTKGTASRKPRRTFACRLDRPSGVLSPGRRAGSGQVSRPIRTGRLRRSRALHRRPVHPVVSRGASVACARGSFIFGEAWRLDAFSAYPVATWLPGRALRQDNRRTRGRPSPVLSY